jgi:hypothetical protein
MNFQNEADIFSKSASNRRQSDHDHFVEKVSNIQNDPGLALENYQQLLFLCIYNSFCSL